MIYLHCPRCRLAIACRADYLMILTNCPRCLARAAITAPLFASPLNGAELHASDREPAHAAELAHTPQPGNAPAMTRADPARQPPRRAPADAVAATAQRRPGSSRGAAHTRGGARASGRVMPGHGVAALAAGQRRGRRVA